MSRYLTPSKVALLSLISIYTEGVVPNSSAIHVLSFVVSYLSPLGAGDAPSSSDGWPAQYSVSIEDLEKALKVHPSSIPGRSIWDLFLRKIWSIDSCDALELFFTEISTTLAKTREERIRERDAGLAPESGCMRLARCSPLGAFVRRAQLEFTRLQFHDSVKLWKGFVKYRLPTYRAWARRNPSDEQVPVDINLLELGLDTSSHLAQVAYGNIEDNEEDDCYVSTKEVERLLEFQIGELQRFGGRVPEELKAQLKRIIASGVTLPDLIHYLSRDKGTYQYALLNLAILQADFGCYEEAVSAMQEAVSIARESHDMNCLNFCMSWLYHFGKAFPELITEVENTGMLGNEKEGLSFLKAKAKETEMWGLLSTTLLSEAKLELQNVLQPSTGYMFRANLAFTSGITHLAWLSSETFRHCYRSSAPFEDHLKSTFRSCQLAAHIIKLAQQGRYNEASAQMADMSLERFQSLKTVELPILSDDRESASQLLSQLRAIDLPDSDLSFLLSFITVEHLIRQADYAQALELIEKTAQSIHQDNFDIQPQVKLLCLKARIFEKMGQPQRGFSLAMRAASIAYRSRLLPGLWEAIVALGGVLLSLKEFEAVAKMVESIMPQVLETSDCDLAASAYSLLVDANMGIAGRLWSEGKDNGPAKKEYMNRALGYLDSAYEQYEEIEDLRGQCEMMAKKATVMHLTGDSVLANDYAAKYLDLRKQKTSSWI
ncbi:hypothetical protein AN4735.2 [Aspergillus nidulans FGSC A4]|uniref:Anaphase-promoting complex subunit 5 n=1 Tax=Emericella nidulans (strain FGSC A4 / ATCC 38163 / CBS 112.46 / NRRL 194 / M139) TaxID=227321 RepID=Q5B3Z5_EMENI|nr:hypothetical protein [Aspergillus nidulans FGSC A4]EAA60777.1 hypothetical protein AN4735.2 [Aspergillus nidulans FGSC A4]CBF76899.1 TPA: anaphase-promoting complex subunit Apc5, putative (AFU_orthologue; AFUA_3G06200) [Aspergillus nidulans FGSC A4]|eukprot:XP_662339.1 hypothetical protein AN4735.2 [Aspergillus nidulans FGSC A4]